MLLNMKLKITKKKMMQKSNNRCPAPWCDWCRMRKKRSTQWYGFYSDYEF